MPAVLKGYGAVRRPARSWSAGAVVWGLGCGLHGRPHVLPMDGQHELFAGDGGGWPVGWRYEADFIDPSEEAALLATLDTLPLAGARYKDFVARREVVSYGGRPDAPDEPGRSSLELAPAICRQLRSRVAAWCGLPEVAFAHLLVSRYAPGTPLGWHRDAPGFEVVVGVSLGGWARMRFRPLASARTARHPALTAHLAPRSVYIMRGAARSDWQHSLAPTEGLRWSITFRTLRPLRG